MKAIELMSFLFEAIKLNPLCECYINGYKIGVNCDDFGDVDLYEVKK